MTPVNTDLIYDMIDRADDGDRDALAKLTAVYHETSHEPLCPHRVGGPCDCIKAQMMISIDALDDLTESYDDLTTEDQ